MHQIELEMQNDQLRRTQLALEESRDRYVDLYEFAPVGYLTLNQHALIVAANLTAAALLGEDRKKLLRRRFVRFVAPEDRDVWRQRFTGLMRHNEQQSCELALLRTDGTGFYARLHCLRITTDDDPSSLRIALTDITERRAAEAEIHRLAYYDPLTALPNRRLLQDRLRQALAVSARSGNYGAILFLDLDHFKVLNDTRGHDVGDILLIEAAQRLQAAVRMSDTVARLGGDEFVVMLEGLSSDGQEAVVQATQGAEKIRRIFVRPYDLKGTEFHCTASIGVALFHGRETVEELLKQADFAMYQAKSGERDGLRFFDPGMQAAVVRRSVLAAELREALKRQQLQLYYQPQIDGAGRVTGAETLLRWMHAERGLLLPGEFISLAEETGLILPIDHWVLTTACTQLTAWQDTAHTRDLQLAVNVSARQFRQPDFVEQVQQVLTQTGADPTRMKIELTESLVMVDIANTLEKMRVLKALGLGFSMDDFGTGYSSLSYLTRLPFDQIKIDQSFVQNLSLNLYDRVMVQTIITMAKSLGLSVIAEGMETEAQREFLDNHDCHAFQGYLFSRPLPLEEFERYLARHMVG